MGVKSERMCSLDELVMEKRTVVALVWQEAMPLLVLFELLRCKFGGLCGYPKVSSGAALAWVLPWLQGEVVGELRANKPSKARPLQCWKP